MYQHLNLNEQRRIQLQLREFLELKNTTKGKSRVSIFKTRNKPVPSNANIYSWKILNGNTPAS